VGAKKDELKRLLEKLENGDPDPIRRAIEELTNVSHKLAEAVYKNQGTSSQTGFAGPENPRTNREGGSASDNDEKVVEAEFRKAA